MCGKADERGGGWPRLNEVGQLKARARIHQRGGRMGVMRRHRCRWLLKRVPYLGML